jgi:hypothetical protein
VWVHRRLGPGLASWTLASPPASPPRLCLMHCLHLTNGSGACNHVARRTHDQRAASQAPPIPPPEATHTRLSTGCPHHALPSAMEAGGDAPTQATHTTRFLPWASYGLHAGARPGRTWCTAGPDMAYGAGWAEPPVLELRRHAQTRYPSLAYGLLHTVSQSRDGPPCYTLS